MALYLNRAKVKKQGEARRYGELDLLNTTTGRVTGSQEPIKRLSRDISLSVPHPSPADTDQAELTLK